MKQTKFPISFADYQRLYCVIATVLDGYDAHTAHACKYFAIVGAYILSSTHKLNATPRFGSALFRVHDASNSVMTFTDAASFQQKRLYSHSEAFHAWIECDGVIIDLMAPHFRESFLSHPDAQIILPRKMFQKPMSKMAESPSRLLHEGDFYLSENPALTLEMMEHFNSSITNNEIAEICNRWYKPNPKAITAQLELPNNGGIQKMMKLKKTQLTGVW